MPVGAIVGGSPAKFLLQISSGPVNVPVICQRIPSAGAIESEEGRADGREGDVGKGAEEDLGERSELCAAVDGRAVHRRVLPGDVLGDQPVEGVEVVRVPGRAQRSRKLCSSPARGSQRGVS